MFDSFVTGVAMPTTRATAYVLNAITCAFVLPPPPALTQLHQTQQHPSTWVLTTSKMHFAFPLLDNPKNATENWSENKK